MTGKICDFIIVVDDNDLDRDHCRPLCAKMYCTKVHSRGLDFSLCEHVSAPTRSWSDGEVKKIFSAYSPMRWVCCTAISPALWPERGAVPRAKMTPDEGRAVLSCLVSCRAYPRLWFVDNHCRDERQEAPILLVVGRDYPRDGEGGVLGRPSILGLRPRRPQQELSMAFGEYGVIAGAFIYARATTNNTF